MEEGNGRGGGGDAGDVIGSSAGDVIGGSAGVRRWSDGEDGDGD